MMQTINFKHTVSNVLYSITLDPSKKTVGPTLSNRPRLNKLKIRHSFDPLWYVTLLCYKLYSYHVLFVTWQLFYDCEINLPEGFLALLESKQCLASLLMYHGIQTTDSGTSLPLQLGLVEEKLGSFVYGHLSYTEPPVMHTSVYSKPYSSNMSQ